jgi:hypothetical protein
LRRSAALDADQSSSIFTGGAAAADADGGTGDAQPDAATAAIGGAGGVSGLMPLAGKPGPSSGGSDAARAACAAAKAACSGRPVEAV